MLKLIGLTPMQRENRRRQIKTRNGSVASRAKRKRSPCQQDENSVDSQIMGYSGPDLPEDIWCHIHSLMPMRDAARVACVARAFLRSWRCHPNLDFSKEALGLITENACETEEMPSEITSRVDHILQNHSGIGVKTLKFQHNSYDSKQDFCHRDLDRWLQNTVKLGIEELNLCLYRRNSMYNFPCSLLSDEIGDSLRYLHLVCCNFHTTSGLGCLRNMTRLQLTTVSITENTLECLLSNSFALERLELKYCRGIIHLRIPCLQQLSYLEVIMCIGLQVLERKAPNVSSVRLACDLHVRLSLSETSGIRTFTRFCFGAAFYARTSLPSSMPNLETLTIFSETETVNTPVMPSRFLNLKFLTVVVGGQTYDCFSVLSFLHASPSLESFILNVCPEHKNHVSVFEDPSDLRKMPENHNDKLKSVKIINFSSAKSLVELTYHIVESAMSLECLTLDSTHGAPRCFVNKSGRCFPISRGALMEARRGVLAAQRYIKPKVPSMVEFNVLEPCSRCHAVEP